MDDTPANLLSLRAILEELGQNLVEARSGEEALERVEAQEFAAVLLDVLMPGIGGFETARAIRGHERSRHTPIIFLTTGDIDRSQTEEAYRLGAVDFLVQPLMPVAFRAKVRGLVELFLDKQRARHEADQLRLLVQGTTDYAIFMLDPQGNVASWNAGAERIKGYKAEEIVGRHFSRFYPPDAIERGWPAHELEVARTEGRFEDEGWRVRKDGARFWANVVITALSDEAGEFRGFLKITRDMTERKRSEENARLLAEEAAARRAAEENARLLHDQRERLHVTLTSIGDAVISTDAEGRVEFLNPVAENLVGWTTDEAARRSLTDVFRIVNEDTRRPVDNPALRALREGRIVGLANHTILISKDGTERPIDDSAAPIRDQKGNISGSVLVFRDISERKRSEAALGERLRLLALNAAVGESLVRGDSLAVMLQRCAGALVDHLHGAFARIWTFNPHDDVLELRASAGLYTHLDGPHSRVPVGHYKIGLIARERKPHLTNAVVGDPRVGDQEWAQREGMVAFAGYPLLVDDRLVGVMAMFARQPLSETTLGAMASVADEIAVGIEGTSAQERLHEQEEWLRVTLASIGDAVIATDTEGRVTFLNGVAQELTGWQMTDARGQRLNAVFTILNEQTRRPVENPVEKVLREGVVVGLANHTVLIAKDGAERPIDDSAAPIRDETGKMIGVVLVFRDVAEQRRAEHELRTSEARKSAILETALDCIITMDHDGRVVEFNPAAERTFGYARSEIVGRKLADFIVPPSLRERHDRGMTHYLATGEGPVLGRRLELPALRADGTEIPVEVSITRIPTDGPPVFTAYLRDISERKRSEAVLAGQKRVLELLVQGAPLPDVLDALCEIVEGQSRDKLIATVLLVDEDGQRLRSVAGRRAPADYTRAVDGVRIGPCVGSCGTAAHRGEPVVVSDIAADPLWADFRDLALGHGLRACWSTPIFSSQGKVLGTFAVYYPSPHRPSPEELRLVDILTRSAGVAVERRRDEEALKEADRRKDEFLATLAHELRNPLAPMRNALQVMQLAGGDGAAVGRAREMMERQMRHMVRLVDDLLDVSRITKDKLDLRKQRVDLAAVVRTAVETSRPLIEAAGHELTITLPPQPVFVDGDPVRLAQVFSNLLNNAAKYTDRGGKIWLAAERLGSDAVVSVRDTGLGIPRDMLGKVFELFTQVDRTLEKAQGGLGIGLTLVRRLTEMHGGGVEAHSEGVGKGSEFIVRLPAIFVPPSRDERATEERTPSSRRRLLVVDDNRDSAVSLGMMLELMGNEVRTAHDGLEAVQAAEVFRPDVILLDIGLPRLNGYEAARRIKGQPWGEDIVLIALTGWGQEEDKRRSKEAGFNFHMVKPVEPAALEKVLAGLLSYH
ncbi:Chemotaxis protein methyltransferase CheR [Fimbriiglobus ruber]|uniref:histidine kinase n=1 Tax=Fimbriiglobus ruber TaxID=1908690 RepID=A0A225D2W4_9BACT|nr:Chemotaxis protein methyltransferase CheR [Fimbriiglobus ruber]